MGDVLLAVLEFLAEALFTGSSRPVTKRGRTACHGDPRPCRKAHRDAGGA